MSDKGKRLFSGILSNKLILPVMIPAVLLLTMLAAMQVNSALTRKHEMEHATMVLMDSAREQAKTLDTILEGQFETLEVFAASISMQDNVEIDNVRMRMSAVAENSTFEHVFYVTTDGWAYDNAGNRVNVLEREYFSKAISGRRTVMSVTSNLVTREPRFILAVPITKRDGGTAGLIMGSYNEKLLRELIISEAYGGTAYSTIYNSDGDYIIGTDSPNYKLKEFANIFSALNSVKLSSGCSIAAMRADMTAGKGGAVSYVTGDGAGRYAVYMPLDIVSAVGKRWYLFNVVPTSMIADEAVSSTRSSSALLVIIALIAAVMMAFIIRRERAHAARLEEDHEQLRLREEQFRIAATHGSRSVGRYDIKTNTYYCESDNPFPKALGSVIKDVPQAFIDAGTIAPESAGEITEYFRRIKAGEENCWSSAALVMEDGSRRWFRSDATIMRDSQGRPSQAILVFYDITEQREKEAVYRKWQESISGRQPEDYTLYRCNLSKGTVTDSTEGELLRIEFEPSSGTFDVRTREYVAQYVHEDDRDGYTAFMNDDALLAKYYRGVRTTSLDFREKDANGDIRWLRVTVEMVEYLDSTDVEAYLLFEDIDEVKKAELLTKERAETDPLTKVLNRITFIDRMGQTLGEMNENSQHALMMLDIDGFKQLNDTLGHDAGDQALVDVANQLRSILRRGDLLGRLGGDEFLIFLKDMPYEAVIDKKAADICSMLRKSYSGDACVTVSIGIAVCPRDGTDFTTLYRHADAALYFAKENGKDRFSFYGSDMNRKTPEQEEVPQISKQKRRLLIVDDDQMSRTMLSGIFKEDFIVDSVKDGKLAVLRMHRYGAGIAAVLLDLSMPGMDGYEVLQTMRECAEIRSIPVVVVSSDTSQETSLRVIGLGAADFVAKPIDPHLLRLRVQAAISRTENERLRAQNSYLMLQSGEEAKYRTVLESTGTVVIEYDWVNGVFVYDRYISQHLSGNYDSRTLWRILLSDMVASVMDVKNMQTMVHDIATDRDKASGSLLLQLRTASHTRHWFRFSVYKKSDEYRLTEKMILTFNDVNDEVLTNEKLRFQAERDELTGLYNRATFMQKAEEMIAGRPPEYYILSAFDVDGFKVINDQYGAEEGDRVLKIIGDVAAKHVEKLDGLCCRVSADNFAMLYPRGQAEKGIVDELRRRDLSPNRFSIPIVLSTGRYVVSDTDLPVSAMYDRAYIAKQSVKGRYDEHIAWFDESMRDELLREQSIVDDMRSALTGKQFEVWLQPQYNHSTGALIGAEALARWRHPAKGLVQPASFIRVFERNGFIYELDKYVWEKSCALLRKWLDEGRSPLPISVNISRCDIFRDDMTDVIAGLTKKYDIPVELLRLEITETAFARSSEQIISTVKALTELGFTIEIDDFGSGYSSLNTLKNVPAQIIKLDMRFLEENGDSSRGGNILESIVRMAKWLNMAVIAEGVETAEQADFLASVGCSYVQGYFYARPMPVADYEALAPSVGKEREMMTMTTIDNLDNDSFWDPKSMETIVFNSFVSGACIFEYHKGRIELLRANKKYAEVLGSAGMTIEEALKLDWAKHLDEENSALVRRALERSIETKDEITEEYVFLNLPNCPEKTYLRSTLRVIARSGDRYLIYCANENITAQREAERREQSANNQMRTIMENVHSGISAYYTGDGAEAPRFVFANRRYFEIIGYTKTALVTQVNDYYTLVHPDDRERIRETTNAVVESGTSAIYEFRCVRPDGGVRNVRCSSSIVPLEGIGDKVLLSVFTDITRLVQAESAAKDASAQLDTIISNMDGGVTASTIGDRPHLVYANDRFYSMLGYTKKQFKTEVKLAYDLICEEDRERVFEQVRGAVVSDGPQSLTFRAIRRDGGTVWLQANISTTLFAGHKEPIQLTVFNDVTEEKRRSQEMAEITDQLMFLNGASKDMIASGDAETAINTVLAKVLDYFSAARAYIFEMNEAGTLFSNTYELCADGVEPQIDKLQNMPRRAADYWFSYFDGHDYLCVDVDSIGEGREAERQVLAAQNISGLIAVPIKKNGKTAGFIGVDDPTRNVTHTDRLAALGTYMAVLTARRDMTAKARRDSEMMKHLMDDTPGGFARKKIMPDGSLVTLYVNEGLCRILGTTREEYMELSNTSTMWGVHPDDAEAVDKALKRVFAGEESRGLQYRRQRKDGGWVWFLVSCRMTVDEAGDRFLNVYYKDLSEQEKQEMDLRESLPIMLSAMLESSSDLSFVKDGDLNYVCCSKAFADMVGLNGTAEIVGRTDYDIFDSELAEKYRADDRKLIDGGKSLVDYIEEIPGSDGHKHWSSTSKYLLRDADGGFIGIYGVGRDITESIVTEKALRVREQEIELAMAQMGKMILLYDIRTKTLTMPEQYARKHGIPAVMEDFPASFAPYRVLQQSDADAYAAFYRSILNGEDNCEAEASFICANGAAVREHAKAITIRDASGKPIKAVISVEEVKG